MYLDGNVTVMVADMDQAVRYYTETLGLKLKLRHENEWAEVTAGDLTVGLHPAGPHGPRPGAAGALSICLGVADLDAAAAELEKRGVSFTHKVDDGPVRLAFFNDPDGNALYLCQVRS